MHFFKKLSNTVKNFINKFSMNEIDSSFFSSEEVLNCDSTIFVMILTCIFILPFQSINLNFRILIRKTFTFLVVNQNLIDAQSVIAMAGRVQNLVLNFILSNKT